jgi:hypothetical protein
VVPQLAPAGLVHFRFPFLPLGQVPPAHSGFYHLKDLFAVIVLLQQVLEARGTVAVGAPNPPPPSKKLTPPLKRGICLTLPLKGCKRKHNRSVSE